MPHPKDLIELIARDLERTYNRQDCEFVIEQAIPGTRFFPDIQVRRSGRLCAVVEIGYTRPEKLAYYRTSLEIADVRWYDKTGHLHGDVQEKVTILIPRFEPREPLYVYEVRERICCQRCLDNLNEGDDDDDVEDNDEPEKQIDYWLADARAGVVTFIITDRDRIIVGSYCDECQETFFFDGELDEDQTSTVDATELISELADLTPQEFGRRYGAAERLTWEEVKERFSGPLLSRNYCYDFAQTWLGVETDRLDWRDALLLRAE